MHAGNPADCASRGLSLPAISHSMSCGGRDLLSDSASPWLDAAMPGNLSEQSSTVHAAGTYSAVEEMELFTRYSLLRKLVRVTAWCRRWRHSRPGNRGETVEDLGTLTVTEVDHALLEYVVQKATYKTEISAVVKVKLLPSKSSFIKLRSFSRTFSGWDAGSSMFFLCTTRSIRPSCSETSHWSHRRLLLFEDTSRATDSCVQQLALLR